MAHLEFTAHGPYKIPVERRSRRLLLDGFWRKGSELEGLAERCGCYVFAIRSGGGIIPHYVGLSTTGFKREVFNPSNLRKYRDAMSDYDRGRPVLFLVAHPHRKGKISYSRIRDVENFLIQAGWARNPDLQNKKGIHRPKWVIGGVIRSVAGKPTMAARRLRAAMGIR